MKILLDTHIVLWWLNGGERLSNAARTAIASRGNLVHVSFVSLWEIVIKVRAGKLAVDVTSVDDALRNGGFEHLPITRAHLAALEALPTHHRDPFDHLLIAQAVAENAIMVSADRIFRNYPVTLLER